jgi:hypothetical protein
VHEAVGEDQVPGAVGEVADEVVLDDQPDGRAMIAAMMVGMITQQRSIEIVWEGVIPRAL